MLRMNEDEAHGWIEKMHRSDCHRCRDLVLKEIPDSNVRSYVALFNRMIVCGNCGNKRCPKASNHDLRCTNSNEPGQEGSVYR